jgi:PPOX class probable F420-dependent enzyme
MGVWGTMSAMTPVTLSLEGEVFVAERHLATLTTLRPDGSPHVVAVGFTWDAATGLARVITFAPSRKARNLAAAPGSRAAVCQVDGGRWLTLEGPATVTDDPARVAEGVRRYAERYRQPGERDDRVVIEIAVDRVLGRA